MLPVWPLRSWRAAPAHGTAGAVDSAVDDGSVEPRDRLEGLAPGTAHERVADGRVVLRTIGDQLRLDRFRLVLGVHGDRGGDPDERGGGGDDRKQALVLVGGGGGDLGLTDFDDGVQPVLETVREVVGDPCERR